MEKHFWATALVTVVIGLSGCGGGDGDGGDDGGQEVDRESSDTGSEVPQPYDIDHLRSDNALALRQMGERGEGIVIGILDTGIDDTTPEFEDTEFLEGFDAVQNDGDRQYDGTAYTDFDGHGTGVASMAFGANLGLAPDATAVSYKVKNDTDTIPFQNQLEALRVALDRGNVDILNVSSGLQLQGNRERNEFRDLVLTGIEEQGWIVVIATGNTGGGNAADSTGGVADDPVFDGHIITVGSDDGNDQLLPSSATATNPSDMVDEWGDIAGVVEHFITAPGRVSLGRPVREDDTDSTYNGYGQGTGTSYAAPQVSGALAMLMSAYPDLTPKQAVRLILDSATDIGDPGVDGITGAGKLNVRAAFDRAEARLDGS